jgi:rSAM/selenodomain-associated transferase 1
MSFTTPIGIGLMCKPPRPGASKTRLAATLGADAAAGLARGFLVDTAAMLSRACATHGLVKKAYFRPADAEDEIAGIIGREWPLAFCDAGDLGASMREALEDLLRLAPAGAIIIGSDLPTLPERHIAEAAACLRAGDERTAVIGPSADGGYYLIGIRGSAAAPLLEPMIWSTPDVLAETRRRAGRHGIRLVEVSAWYDIDEAGDLDRIADDAAGLAVATRAALAKIRESRPHV